MTFNEWWAGQNLPEESKVVALAAWYAGQLYNGRTPQHVDTANLAMSAAHGAQLDALAAAIGLTRNNGGGWPEDDADFRARIIQGRNRQWEELRPTAKDLLGCQHSFIDEGVFFTCSKCGVRR